MFILSVLNNFCVKTIYVLKMDFKAACLCLFVRLILTKILVLVEGTQSHTCCKYDTTDWNNCIGFKWNNSHCIIINTCETDHSNQCPAKCFVLEDLCVSDCPTGSFEDWNKPGYCKLCDISCLSCYDKGPSHCTSCSQDYYLYQESRCVSQCPNNLIPYQGKCLQNCPAIVFNGTCVDTCPQGFYTDRIGSNCKACNEECISCFSDGSESCKKCRHFRHERTCVSKCPDDAKYVDNMRCKSVCLHNHYSNNTCTEKCPSDDFIHDGMCVDKCPAGSYYTENTKICVTECPHYTVKNKCVHTCPRGMYILERKCLQKCPPDYIFSSSNFTCLTNCTKLRYRHQCLDKCPFDAMVIYNGTCAMTCPGRFPVTDPITRQCVNKCSYFNYNGICTSACPENTYPVIESKVCLQCDKACVRCTGPHSTDCVQCKQYVDGGSKHMCRKDCDEGYYSHGNICYKLCVKSEDEYNNCKENCVVHCPSSKAVSAYRNIDFNNTVDAYFISSSYTCVKQCSNYMAVERNKLLMCVEKCPDETPYNLTGICSAYPIPNTFYLVFILVTFIISFAVITGCIYNEKKMGRFCFRKDKVKDFNKLYKQYVAGKCN